ncbi:uncharacterized protein BDZ83DRAFT_604287 [Colletotrichum acutatum]|uniref:Secreted protein n=1 Tax=Glomerella acutata TaxID=27357 RepID=A0AAD8XMD4_GLOAC|nr:uncharacterized protein BDZ83DRAFT_604287 [Colletotrichum acutatum]KAK1729972.1 hypothetical protein BDZ83DRAFT_604287 [Colletotrichum acutatum]
MQLRCPCSSLLLISWGEALTSLTIQQSTSSLMYAGPEAMFSKFIASVTPQTGTDRNGKRPLTALPREVNSEDERERERQDNHGSRR